MIRRFRAETEDAEQKVFTTKELESIAKQYEEELVRSEPLGHSSSFSGVLKKTRQRREVFQTLGNANLDLLKEYGRWVLAADAERGVAVSFFLFLILFSRNRL